MSKPPWVRMVVMQLEQPIEEKGRQVATLESYLQEVAAENIMQSRRLATLNTLNGFESLMPFAEVARRRWSSGGPVPKAGTGGRPRALQRSSGLSGGGGVPPVPSRTSKRWRFTGGVIRSSIYMLQKSRRCSCSQNEVVMSSNRNAKLLAVRPLWCKPWSATAELIQSMGGNSRIMALKLFPDQNSSLGLFFGNGLRGSSSDYS